MELVVNRSPAFWRAVGDHPELNHSIEFNGLRVDLGELCLSPKIMPLASEHGGFFFIQLDGTRRIFELHTFYRPEGWGREVAEAARKAASAIFFMGAELITTLEREGEWRTRPPKSHGWKVCGGFAGNLVSTRLWLLTRENWESSAVFRRLRKCLS